MSNPIPDVKNPEPLSQATIDCALWTPQMKGSIGIAMDRALMHVQRQIMNKRGELEWDDKTGRFIMSLRIDNLDAQMAPYLKGAEEVWIITKPCTLPEGEDS